MTGVVAEQTLQVGRWHLLHSRSCAGFAVRNFGLKTVRGTVPIQEAWVDVGGDARPGAVFAALDLTGIDTGHARRDADLRKPHLLDTARYPTLTFTGGAPQPAPDGWQVPGRLAGRAAADLVLAGRIVRAAPGEVTVHATVTVDRRALGVGRRGS